MPDLKDLFAQVDAALDDIVALEQALVQIPSVNTGAMPTGNETAVCDYAREWLAEDGIESEIPAKSVPFLLRNTTFLERDSRIPFP